MCFSPIYFSLLVFFTTLSLNAANFYNLLRQNIFIDFKLVSEENKEFPCHKLILANFNPYFQKMLNANMQEAKTGTAILPLPNEAMDILLDFIYIPQYKIATMSVWIYIALRDYAHSIFADDLVKELNQVKIIIKKDELNDLIAYISDNKDRDLATKIRFTDNKRAGFEKPFLLLQKKFRYSEYPSFSPDGEYIVTAGYNPELIKSSDGSLLRSLKADGNNYCQVIVSPDQNHTISTSWCYDVKIAKIDDTKIYMFDSGDKHKICGQGSTQRGSNFSSDGMRFITLYSEGRPRSADSPWEGFFIIRSITDGSIISQFPFRFDNTYPTIRAVFSPEGSQIVFLPGDSVMNANNGKELFKFNHKGTINSVSYSSDGRFILTASSDKTAMIINAHDGSHVRTLLHENCVANASFMADGQRILTSSGQTKIWRISDGALLLTLHNSGRTFAHNEKHIFTGFGGYNSEIKMWDAIYGKFISTFKMPIYATLYGSAFLNADGRRLLLNFMNGMGLYILFPSELYDDDALFNHKDQKEWLLLRYYFSSLPNSQDRDEIKEHVMGLIEKLMPGNSDIFLYLDRLVDGL